MRIRQPANLIDRVLLQRGLVLLFLLFTFTDLVIDQYALLSDTKNDLTITDNDKGALLSAPVINSRPSITARDINSLVDESIPQPIEIDLDCFHCAYTVPVINLPVGLSVAKLLIDLLDDLPRLLPPAISFFRPPRSA
jgi:hypothetical protein